MILMCTPNVRGKHLEVPFLFANNSKLEIKTNNMYNIALEVIWMLQKKELRTQLKRRREQLSAKKINEAGLNVLKLLTSLDEIKQAKSVGITLPMRGEVDLKLFIEWCFTNNKKVYIPNTENKLMRFGELSQDYSELFETKLGTLEPHIKNDKIPNIDVQLIPGVAFDKKGGRLGFGGGFYDRYLENFSGLKISVCYDFQLIDEVPTEKHDIMMDMIVTEKQMLNIKNSE